MTVFEFQNWIIENKAAVNIPLKIEIQREFKDIIEILELGTQIVLIPRDQ